MYDISEKLSPFLSDDTILQTEETERRYGGKRVSFTYDTFLEYAVSLRLYRKWNIEPANLEECKERVEGSDFPMAEGVCDFLERMVDGS